jgi:ligand-binding sensor domain-containing protein/serine phosphatase RsbU (regulator of sigma subunit)
MRSIHIKPLLILLVVFICNQALFSQSINLKKYGIDQGIIHPTVYTLNQDKSGFLWLGTGAGVCRFDGIKFSIPPSTDTLIQNYANSSFRDSKGRVWFGYDDGSIYLYSGRKLSKIYKNEEAPSIVNSFTEDANGNIIAATQNSGLYFIESSFKVTRVNKGFKNTLIYSICNVGENKLLLGTDNGLLLYSYSVKHFSTDFLTKVNDIPSTKIQCIIPVADNQSFWVGTQDAGFYKLHVSSGQLSEFSVENIGQALGFSDMNVQWVLEDTQKNLWICTFGNGVFKVIYSAATKKYTEIVNYNQENGFDDNYIKVAFQDVEGNIWFGTYSNGLVGIIDEAFVFYSIKDDGFGNDILSITSGDGYVWLGTRKAVIKVEANNSRKRQVFTERNGIPSDAITSLCIDNKGILWIGTEKSGLYKMNTSGGSASKFFKSANSIENKINSIKFLQPNLWVATNGGVFSFNLTTGKQDHYSTDNGLPHNKINDLYVDSKGIVWIATKSNGIQAVNSDKHFKISGNAELEFTSITSDKEGNMWASTYGDGVFEFTKDSLIYLSEQNGLKSNYCYSIITDNDNNIWVGHRLALSKIYTSNNTILKYGNEIGIKGDCNANAVSKDQYGTLRFGTSEGLVQYNYQKNRQRMVPPALNVLSVKISDKEVDYSDKIQLSYGIYRIRVDFVGLNFRAPTSVKYQYKLEGWETEWSDITENTYAYYPRIEDGEYKFLLRAYNAEGIANTEPLSLEIYVKPPFWKRWWFIAFCVTLIIGSFYLFLKLRERKQKMFQIYLQELLDERTREVVEQKEEIELKNRDITDSINYAQRIQASILPSMRKIQDNFSGCFIFYQPRDIVSGDFYWFDKITDTKFVIVCGDSTGHGVPGALMSMIGTTLIKDICNRPDVVSPSDILDKLDSEMQQTLNQNLEAEKSSDGMDLIACEIDTDTHQVRIASAMRPVIIYQNGEQIYVPGSKSSIGGENYVFEDKVFEDKVFSLSKGDLVYMFSDGYPDQFGGPMGKKYKMVRLRNLLKDIHDLPMEEQYNHVKSTFNLWKDTLDQVDDVLFMGIRI